ncbi:SET methyltransferase domain containing protein [Nitzschia inconspicua]|uniref:SET methyltransferase domain containing protein n=1 Tax=Nitzschia inconspicua TaxID=303405 RepID=A0A9K3PVI2_9STRA|nr:SET methyltransferase domain containing protein [Nitzschia inconspicua]
MMFLGCVIDDISINPLKHFWVVDAAEATKKSDSEMLKDVMRWAESHGAFFNPKVETRPIVGDLSGIFAKEPMKEGEIVSKIPWDIIVKPPPGEGRGLCAAISAALEVLRKDPDEQTPYDKYLSSRPIRFHPMFWSTKGHELLHELIGDLPPDEDDFSPQRFLDHFGCEDFDFEDDTVHKALMLVMTRSEGHRMDCLVPFNDLINHKNGHSYTAEPRYEEGEYFAIVTRRDVEAGEEIRNSYNQCEFCLDFSNCPSFELIFVTPHLFDHYGFVEPYPQRWIIPSRRLLFDVMEVDGNDGILNATFAIPPSSLGVQFLHDDIARLKLFAERLISEKPNIPDIEYNTLLEYHQSILRAYELAYEQSKLEVLTDEVWYRHRDYWWEEEVQQGANAAITPSSSFVDPFDEEF